MKSVCLFVQFFVPPRGSNRFRAGQNKTAGDFSLIGGPLDGGTAIAAMHLVHT